MPATLTAEEVQAATAPAQTAATQSNGLPATLSADEVKAAGVPTTTAAPTKPASPFTSGGPTLVSPKAPITPANLPKATLGDAANTVSGIFPGGQLGNALANSAEGLKALATGDQATYQRDANANGANAEKVIGDTVQAAALPASLLVGGGETALSRIAASAGAGGVLGAANAASEGGTPTDIATEGVEGLGAGALGSGAVEAATPLLAGKDTVESALDRISPDINSSTPTQTKNLISQKVSTSVDGAKTTLPRVNEGGLLSGRTVNLTDTEKAAAQELAQVPGYKPSLTNLQTYNLVQNEIASKGAGLEASLKSENILVPKQEIVNIVKNATGQVPNESTLLARGDAPLANYVRTAKAAAAQNDGTLAGVLQTRKDLDAAYANARGKLAYGSDKIAPLDEIHQEARNALNDYLAEHAQNTDVKAALRSQSLLYRASDAILPKAAKESGSGVARLVGTIKAHPLGAALTGGATALGADKILKATTGVGL